MERGSVKRGKMGECPGIKHEDQRIAALNLFGALDPRTAEVYAATEFIEFLAQLDPEIPVPLTKIYLMLVKTRLAKSISPEIRLKRGRVLIFKPIWST